MEKTIELLPKRYNIVEDNFLGQGTSGIVYKALDTEFDPARSVAIKVLLRHLRNDPDRLQQFKHEASVLASINSPYILRIHDFNINHKVPFMVTDLAAWSLDKLLSHNEIGRNQAIPLKQVLKLLEGICEGLDEAHSEGLVHRDIKPSNILLDKKGRPLISDFGIAIIIEKQKPSILKHIGTVTGTLEYMAPEVLTGKVGILSDVYSLALLTFVMLTGKIPQEPMFNFLPGQFPSVSIVSNLSPLRALDEVIARGMAYKLEERTQSAGAFYNEFKKVVDAWEHWSIYNRVKLDMQNQQDTTTSTKHSWPTEEVDPEELLKQANRVAPVFEEYQNIETASKERPVEPGPGPTPASEPLKQEPVPVSWSQKSRSASSSVGKTRQYGDTWTGKAAEQSKAEGEVKEENTQSPSSADTDTRQEDKHDIGFSNQSTQEKKSQTPSTQQSGDVPHGNKQPSYLKYLPDLSLANLDIFGPTRTNIGDFGVRHFFPLAGMIMMLGGFSIPWILPANTLTPLAWADLKQASIFDGNFNISLVPSVMGVSFVLVILALFLKIRVFYFALLALNLYSLGWHLFFLVDLNNAYPGFTLKQGFWLCILGLILSISGSCFALIDSYRKSWLFVSKVLYAPIVTQTLLVGAFLLPQYLADKNQVIYFWQLGDYPAKLFLGPLLAAGLAVAVLGLFLPWYISLISGLIIQGFQMLVYASQWVPTYQFATGYWLYGLALLILVGVLIFLGINEALNYFFPNEQASNQYGPVAAKPTHDNKHGPF